MPGAQRLASMWAICFIGSLVAFEDGSPLKTEGLRELIKQTIEEPDVLAAVSDAAEKGSSRVAPSRGQELRHCQDDLRTLKKKRQRLENGGAMLHRILSPQGPLGRPSSRNLGASLAAQDSAQNLPGPELMKVVAQVVKEEVDAKCFDAPGSQKSEDVRKREALAAIKERLASKMDELADAKAKADEAVKRALLAEKAKQLVQSASVELRARIRHLEAARAKKETDAQSATDVLEKEKERIVALQKQNAELKQNITAMRSNLVEKKETDAQSATDVLEKEKERIVALQKQNAELKQNITTMRSTLAEKQRGGGRPPRKHRNLEWVEGAKCGLTPQQIRNTENTLRCRKGSSVYRVAGNTIQEKMQMSGILTQLSNIFNFVVGQGFKIAEQYLPSNECCKAVFAELPFGPKSGHKLWTERVSEICCANVPESEKLKPEPWEDGGGMKCDFKTPDSSAPIWYGSFNVQGWMINAVKTEAACREFGGEWAVNAIANQPSQCCPKVRGHIFSTTYCNTWSPSYGNEAHRVRAKTEPELGEGTTNRDSWGVTKRKTKAVSSTDIHGSNNLGAACWYKCRKKNGPCPKFCGTGYCCRKLWKPGYDSGCPPEAGGAISHQCIARPKSTATRRRRISDVDSHVSRVGKRVGKALASTALSEARKMVMAAVSKYVPKRFQPLLNDILPPLFDGDYATSGLRLMIGCRQKLYYPVLELAKVSGVVFTCMGAKYKFLSNLRYALHVGVTGAPQPNGRNTERNWIEVMKDTFQPLVGDGKVEVKPGCPGVFCLGIADGSIPESSPLAHGLKQKEVRQLQRHLINATFRTSGKGGPEINKPAFFRKLMRGTKLKNPTNGTLWGRVAQCLRNTCGDSKGMQSLYPSLGWYAPYSNFLRSREYRTETGAMRVLERRGEAPNFKVLNGTCQGNNEDKMYGPVNMTFSRWLLPDGDKVKVMQRVCDFTFAIDTHICRPSKCEVCRDEKCPDGKNRSILEEQIKWNSCQINCCHKENRYVARLTSSNQNRANGAQVPGHNCMGWYLATLPFIQSVAGGLSGVYTNWLQDQCNADRTALCKCADNKANGDEEFKTQPEVGHFCRKKRV